MEQLNRQLEAPDSLLTGQIVRGHAFLQLTEGKRSLLSPFLNLELEEGPDGTMLSGRYSPAPNVWTGFMAIYIFLGLCGFAGLIYGWAQTTVDEFPWGFIVLPASLALMAFVYGAAVIGQGLTADEMYVLRAFVDKSVDRAGAIETDRSP